jgi:hypothetical protein
MMPAACGARGASASSLEVPLRSGSGMGRAGGSSWGAVLAVGDAAGPDVGGRLACTCEMSNATGSGVSAAGS